MKAVNKSLLPFLIIFALTLGSELINNIILLGLFFIYYKDLKFSSKQLLPVLILLIFLIPFFIFSMNINVLRIIIYFPRFLFLIYLIDLFRQKININDLNQWLRVVFYVHCITILICAIYPPLNIFFNKILLKPVPSEFRISGLFSGYDLVSFFTLTYLFVQYKKNSSVIDRSLIIQILFGFISTLVTGRFGLVLYGLFFLLIFFKNITFTKVAFFVSTAILITMVFKERVNWYYGSFRLIVDAIQLEDPLNTPIPLEDYGLERQEGIFTLSPIVLMEEASRPFHNIKDYLLPNNKESEVDSGPSFIVLNLGLIAAIFIYLYYFKNIFNLIHKEKFLIIILIILDIKFRIVLTILPTVWLLLNSRLLYSIKTKDEDYILYN